MLVTPHTAEDNIILLSSLERIHTRDFNLFVQILLQGAIELHVVHDVRSLTLVRRDNTDLTRHYTAFEELGDDFLDI